MTAPNDSDTPLADIWRVPLEQGWSFFQLPLGVKAPNESWRRWHDERPDKATVCRWAERESNVGIVTGAVSGIVVLDLDSAEAMAEAERRGLPDTVTVRTGKGRHVYFQHPGGTVGNRTALLPRMDFRGDGGYVVGPGSLHSTGAIYEWENSPEHFDLAPMPDWLVELLKRPEVNPETSAQTSQAVGKSYAYTLAALNSECEAIRSAPNGAQESTLNTAAFKMGQYIGGGCLDYETGYNDLLQAAQAMPSHDLHKPWTDENLSEKIRRALGDGMNQPKGVPEYPQLARPARNNTNISDGDGGGDGDNEAGVQLRNFRAYMPTHSYIFMPTGDLWPAASVNARLDHVPLSNRNGESRLDGKGSPVMQKSSDWLDQNLPVEQMTWAPGMPQVIENRLVSDGGWRDENGLNVFNLYRPPLPIEGNSDEAGRWLNHIRRVYPEDADHLIKWLAHRVQRPEEKINHAIVLGGAQGIGKDTILEPVKAAIGPWNFTEVSPQQLLGRFNGFVKSVILRVSETRDLGDTDRFAFYAHMKTYTAAPPDVLRVDEKHLREYSVFNVCGVILTTNHKTDGIFLPADDRRHYVAWSSLSRDAFPEDYWSDLYGWYQSGGVGHVAAYLRDVDLSDFDPKTPPHKTAAFWDIVSVNTSPEDAELADALERLGCPDAVTLADIKGVADLDFRDFLSDRKNNRRIPHRLERCGYAAVRNEAANDGMWRVSGKRCRIYARQTLSLRDQIAAAEALSAW